MSNSTNNASAIFIAGNSGSGISNSFKNIRKRSCDLMPEDLKRHTKASD